MMNCEMRESKLIGWTTYLKYWMPPCSPPPSEPTMLGDIIYVIVPGPLVVVITGGGGVLTAGASHSLTSGGASMTYTYQWLRYDGDIVGETSSTISFSPLREADVGRYNCRVSDCSMTTTSDGVLINVEGECNGKMLTYSSSTATISCHHINW